MTTWTSRERLRTTLRRQEPDRIPRVEICFWPETVERWRKEGLPADQEPAQAFDLDVIAMVGGDFSLRLPTEVIEETEQYKIERDADGTVHKLWKENYAPPCELDHLIKTREDWAQYRDRLQPDPDRFPAYLSDQIRNQHENGQFVAFSPTEPVWWTLRTLGMEPSLLALAMDPEWFGEIVATHAEMVLALTRHLLAQGPAPDALWFFSDLCYRNGMLFSPQAYRTWMQPWHRQFADLCHEHDMSLILHCDGDVGQFIPLLIESGFDCIQPLEARAGNDVRRLKPLYGDQISFFGNMDMDVYATGDRERVREEVVSKVEVAKVGGGYIHHSDHSVPPTVSYEIYRYAQELAKEHGGYGG
jgi:uroporphyrinogen decarboxylase